MNEVLRCPVCANVLPFRPPCACGFILRESDGILDFLTPQDEAAEQQFLQAYNRVRTVEAWGGDDMDLPFHPKRHLDIWAIRQRTFARLESLVKEWRPERVLDVGAGNCWLSNHLQNWAPDVFAVDINISPADGLGAGQTYIDRGAKFLRVRARMERLPFADGRITLIVASASFHYAKDVRSVLSECRRVLDPAGRIVIMDSPFYRSESDGDRMVEDRVVQFRSGYGIEESIARRSSYLTRERLEESLDGLAMQYEMHSIPPGLRRTYVKWRSRLLGRRIAEFPVIVIRHQQ